MFKNPEFIMRKMGRLLFASTNQISVALLVVTSGVDLTPLTKLMGQKISLSALHIHKRSQKQKQKFGHQWQTLDVHCP